MMDINGDLLAIPRELRLVLDDPLYDWSSLQIRHISEGPLAKCVQLFFMCHDPATKIDDKNAEETPEPIPNVATVTLSPSGLEVISAHIYSSKTVQIRLNRDISKREQPLSQEQKGDLIAAGVKVKLASNDRGEVHLLGCYPGRTGHKIVCEEIQPDKIIQEDAAAESPCPKLRVMVVNKLYMSHFIGDDQAFFI